MSIIESKSAPAVDDDSEDEESAVLQAEEEVDDSPDSNVVVDYSEKEIERSVRLAELKAKWEGSNDQGHSSTRLNYLMAQSEAFCQFLSGDMQSISTDDKATAKKKGRGRMTEAAEDQEMMKRMQDSTIFTRLSKQPATIVGGTLRSYQLEGLNWLIRLNENYVNGILADEMGLGTPIVERTFPTVYVYIMSICGAQERLCKRYLYWPISARAQASQVLTLLWCQRPPFPIG